MATPTGTHRAAAVPPGLPPARPRAWRSVRAWLLGGLLAWVAATPLAQPEGATRLNALAGELAQPLRNSPFGVPVLLESAESGGVARGDVHALLRHPYGTVQAALRTPAQWCELLVLHLNVKRCEPAANQLLLYLGTKHRQPPQTAFRLQLGFSRPADSPGFLQVHMRADDGPMGTHDYRFLFEATPAADGGTFVHFGYQLAYGALARAATQGYLHTFGRDKRGFSLVPPAGGGAPEPVGGLRGAVERNTLRYQLAIEAYLDSLSAAQPGRLEQRLRAWFDATERYAAQLHEITREEYLAMKRVEATD